MEPVQGAHTFQASGTAYDAFMGRYSRALAPLFADHLCAARGQKALDLGCGPGSLTAELVQRLGPDAVAACDPSPSFVEACAARHPSSDIRFGRAEAIPFPDNGFDIAAAQLVFHFVTDPAAAASELRRVVRPGGTIGACVWDFDHGMEMLRAFWDAALDLDRDAPDEARTLRFGRAGEIGELFADAGLNDVTETTLQAQTTYENFDELWNGFCAGIGPAGSYCVSLANNQRAQLRDRLHTQLGSPTTAFTLHAVARSTIATSPTTG
ncbi:MAG: class I SAM-dependent methyltransferase [Acidimicrobiales bacterium]|nr:class I SAM-dependent methyltransferase [Acidimicrobiales bacterium]